MRPGGSGADQCQVGGQNPQKSMHYKLDPEEETKVLDLVLLCYEDI